MSCAACVARVEKALKALPEVEEVSVNLLTNSALIKGDVKPETVISALSKAGYGGSIAKGENQKTNPANPNTTNQNSAEIKILLKRFIASVIFLILLMYISMGHMVGLPLPTALEQNPLALGLIQLLLTGAVMVINQRFFVSGFKALAHRSPNMDTLIAIGSAAAFGYSTYALFSMTFAATIKEQMGYYHELYFESAAMILTLITLGKMLEAKSKGKTTDAIKKLTQLAPKTATVLRSGEEITLPVGEVKKGDIFLLKPGEAVPVDGTVIEGSSAIDESALTGESVPTDKTVGDKVSAATINRSGFLKCEATAVGEDTTLFGIIKMVSDAAATKAPIAKAADKVAGVFVPAVMAVALLTALIWLILGYSFGFSLERAISVLVISCPCALGLATPVAIMVASGVGAKNGILFKTATALEMTGRVKTVVLDKTGTITEGKPTVTDIIPLGDVTENDLLAFAYSLEKQSEHPLSIAICKKAEELKISPFEVKDFMSETGKGLTANINGKKIYGGNYSYISSKVSIKEKYEDTAKSLATQGKTPLYFTLENKLMGIIGVADIIKADSISAIKSLKAMGIKTVMLTGDNRITAKAVGELCGVDEVIAGVLPEGKEKAVRALKEKSAVIMVGDGINDAPALVSADVGIAIGAGTDIAIDAADVVLAKNRITDVVAAITLSKHTLNNIHENLFWAFIYNAIGIPLAAGVFISLFGWELSPMFGAAAMSLSSFSVVTNALRLNFKDIYKFKTKKKNNKLKQNKNKIKETILEEKKMTVTMKIEGMMCPRCEAHVKKALEAIEGVELATPSHEKNIAEVVLNKEVDLQILKKAVEEEGYTVV